MKIITERIVARLGGPQVLRDLKGAFNELSTTTNDLTEIRNNSFFLSHIADRPIPGSRFLSSAAVRVDNAVQRTDEYISAYQFPPEIEPDAEKALLKVVPDQQLGPVYFEVVQNRLRVRHTAAKPDDADKSNVESAASAIAAQGEKLAENLEMGNFDRRVISTVRDIVERVKSKQDIVELGIANLAAQLVFRAAKNEMADVAFAELEAFGVALSMYVAQFPQWIRFSDNAASAEYTAGDVKRIYETGLSLANDLEKVKANVDPEIPRTLRWMAEAIRNPRLAAKRAIFASIRTIENLVAVVLRTFSSWLGSIKDGVNSGTKKVATVATVTALLYAVAYAGLGLAPDSALGIANGWVKTASQIVLKELAAK